jgi:hypothetical protein
MKGRKDASSAQLHKKIHPEKRRFSDDKRVTDTWSRALIVSDSAKGNVAEKKG